MIVTYRWLKEFVDIDFSPEELAHRLTMAGLEVDSMEKLGEGLDSVVVARLVSVEPHPEADRLTLCQVDNGSEIVPVVCGATNHRAGDLVALAQVGSVLPGDFKIKKSKIRGRESMGMLCSERELGLAQESAGILILPPDLSLGTPVFEALGLKDVRLELGLTPNRADCLSVVGVAREIAAMAGKPLRAPFTAPVEGGEPVEEQASVTVDEAALCPRYAARLIRGVKIGPSPEWLVKRLETVGMRSINNVVDVTNLLLMELGHPLHAFDFNLLRGKRIVVRRASEGEVFTTLDGQKRTLKETDLTICDGEGPVALAGIMGGENSEIQPETTDILLESAYFNPTAIRRTSKRLGLHTESSHRFERGADINMVPVALDRAAALIADLAGGVVARGRIDVHPLPQQERRLAISRERTEAILGIRIEIQEIARLLRSIGLDVEPSSDGAAQAVVPTWRHDLEREIDLIEEIARLNGYDRIPVTMPASRVVSHRPASHQRQAVQVRDALVGRGFSEIINYSFVSPAAWELLSLAEDDSRRRTVRVLNPLTEEQSVMRTTLVHSMLETISRNLSYKSRDLHLFEMRPVFVPCEGEELPSEKMHLVAAMCGRREPEGWAQGRELVDFYDLKGVAEELAAIFRIRAPKWESDALEPFFHPGKSCRLKSANALLGSMGEIHPRVLENYGIDLPVFLLDLDMEALFGAPGESRGFRTLSRFPDVTRDSAFLVSEDVNAEQVLSVIDRAKGKDVEEVVLFDVYRGKGVPDGKKSMAVRVRYRSPERTLTDEEISRLHGRIVQALTTGIDAEIR